MGTRGLFGFYYKGKYYLMYNQYDSYPDGLGATMVAFLKKGLEDGKLDEWMLALDNIVVIDPDVKPTPNDIEMLKTYTNLSVSEQSTDDWYCLTRECQGDLQAILDSGYILPHIDPDVGEIECDLFIEWIYVIDLDDNQFKVKGEGINESYSFNELPTY